MSGVGAARWAGPSARRCAICGIAVPWKFRGALCDRHRLAMLHAVARSESPTAARMAQFLLTPVREKGGRIND